MIASLRDLVPDPGPSQIWLCILLLSVALGVYVINQWLTAGTADQQEVRSQLYVEANSLIELPRRAMKLGAFALLLGALIASPALLAIDSQKLALRGLLLYAWAFYAVLLCTSCCSYAIRSITSASRGAAKLGLSILTFYAIASVVVLSYVTFVLIGTTLRPFGTTSLTVAVLGCLSLTLAGQKYLLNQRDFTIESTAIVHRQTDAQKNDKPDLDKASNIGKIILIAVAAALATYLRAQLPLNLSGQPLTILPFAALVAISIAVLPSLLKRSKPITKPVLDIARSRIRPISYKRVWLMSIPVLLVPSFLFGIAPRFIFAENTNELIIPIIGIATVGWLVVACSTSLLVHVFLDSFAPPLILKLASGVALILAPALSILTLVGVISQAPVCFLVGVGGTSLTWISAPLLALGARKIIESGAKNVDSDLDGLIAKLPYYFPMESRQRFLSQEAFDRLSKLGWLQPVKIHGKEFVQVSMIGLGAVLRSKNS